MIWSFIFPLPLSSIKRNKLFPHKSEKEYATIDAIMAYLDLTPFRIKVDRIFNGLNFTLYGDI